MNYLCSYEPSTSFARSVHANLGKYNFLRILLLLHTNLCLFAFTISPFLFVQLPFWHRRLVFFFPGRTHNKMIVKTEKNKKRFSTAFASRHKVTCWLEQSHIVWVNTHTQSKLCDRKLTKNEMTNAMRLKTWCDRTCDGANAIKLSSFCSSFGRPNMIGHIISLFSAAGLLRTDTLRNRNCVYCFGCEQQQFVGLPKVFSAHFKRFGNCILAAIKFIRSKGDLVRKRKLLQRHKLEPLHFAPSSDRNQISFMISV